jgi:hypothetical protein
VRLLTLTAVLAVLAAPAPTAELFSFNRSGAFPSGLPYSVSITTKPFVKTAVSQPDDGGLWGIDGGFPRQVVGEFAVRFGTTEAVLFRKYVADLTNVHGASLEAKSEGNSNELLLYLRGGDAAGSFRAELLFRDCRLVERTVRMGEFPDTVWERLTVSNFEVEACGRTRR